MYINIIAITDFAVVCELIKNKKLYTYFENNVFLLQTKMTIQHTFRKGSILKS